MNAVPALTLDDAQQSHCGWFDSSYELSAGLTVTETELDPIWFECLSKSGQRVGADLALH
ncbi:hypothetical protein [Pelomonas sp. KK5]|uniref:hypothetical protein n=1 Tax=Pelomonas sp. KK5 TaxID=1855730 RepID=UPI00097C926B|nr:hypothetical protein [Pelomonas sp. KK5]